MEYMQNKHEGGATMKENLICTKIKKSDKLYHLKIKTSHWKKGYTEIISILLKDNGLIEVGVHRGTNIVFFNK